MTHQARATDINAPTWDTRMATGSPSRNPDALGRDDLDRAAGLSQNRTRDRSEVIRDATMRWSREQKAVRIG